MKFTTAITRNCNLRCRYCYISHEEREMDTETAKQAVNFALGQLPRGELLDFGFFGGEPLLNLPLMRHITQCLRDRQQEIYFDLVMGLTSNGVVLTPEALEFMAQERIGLCISLDGPEDVYSHQRRAEGNNGVFGNVVDNLCRAVKILPRVKSNAVYGPGTLNRLPDSVRFLVGFGIPINLNIDIMTPWTTDSLAGVEHIFSEIGQIYLDQFRRDKPVELHPLEDSLLVAAFGGCARESRCTLGVGELAVDVTGDIYPCERLVGRENLIIGNVYQGINEDKRSLIVQEHSQPYPACIDCSIRDYCSNSCGCGNE
jgi:uncharacterized protein